MQCARFEQRVSDRIERDLAATDARWMDVHETACGRCRALSRDVRAWLELASELPPVEVPDGLLQRIASHPPPARRRWDPSRLLEVLMALPRIPTPALTALLGGALLLAAWTSPMTMGEIRERLEWAQKFASDLRVEVSLIKSDILRWSDLRRDDGTGATAGAPAAEDAARDTQEEPEPDAEASDGSVEDPEDHDGTGVSSPSR